jgi:hypothetical protein
MCPQCAVAYALRHPPETPQGTFLLGKLIAAMLTQTFISFYGFLQFMTVITKFPYWS